MKILSIGNSFAQDAHNLLHKIAVASDFEMETVNLYIGGCSLERHWNNYLANKSGYDLERNGGKGESKISLIEALEMDDWDIITMQQVSDFSGVPESYTPYLTKLAELVQKKQPQAKIYFHQTWAYEIDSKHKAFPTYNNRQEEMFVRTKDCSEMAAKLIGVDIFPVGEVVQKLRNTLPEFDYANGGKSLCRDGFHLTLDYGRFAAAATWFMILSKQEVNVEKFAGEDYDVCLLEKIVDVIKTVI